MADVDDRGRHDERTVEMMVALALGVGTFLGLVVLGWASDKALQALTPWSLRPVVPALVVAAAVAAVAVIVRQLVRARRRGL